MKLFLFLFLLFLTVFSSQYVPIPKKSYGLNLGTNAEILHIQAFYDLLCSDSKAAQQNLRKALSLLQSQLQLKLTYYMVPLPYHVYSFKVTQGYFFIKQNYSTEIALTYLQYVLNRQQAYYEKNWSQYSIDTFIQYFTNDIYRNVEKIDRNAFKKALASGSKEDRQARAQWKYATGSLSVSGTPIFYANGVRIDGAQQFNFSTWHQFLQSYL